VIGRGELVEVKREMAARHGRPEAVLNRHILAVLERVGGDVDLAATAMVMRPRPGWVAEIIPDGAGLPVRVVRS
jgi:hypothetical protein